MFLADFGAYDVQFEGFGGDYVFWAGSAQSEGRRHMHPEIKSPPGGPRQPHAPRRPKELGLAWLGLGFGLVLGLGLGLGLGVTVRVGARARRRRRGHGVRAL